MNLADLAEVFVPYDRYKSVSLLQFFSVCMFLFIYFFNILVVLYCHGLFLIISAFGASKR